MSSSDTAVFSRLLRALRRCVRGQYLLFFVRCNSSMYRQSLVEELRAQSQQPFLEISVRDLQQKYDLTQIALDEALRMELESLAADIPVFIYDLEVVWNQFYCYR